PGPWLDRLIVATLTAMPILGTAAVIVDEPLECSRLFRQRLPSLVTNGALRALQLGLLATAVAIYGVTQAAGDGERWAPSTTALLLLAIAVGVMIASHPSWPGAIERCLFRRGADRDARLVHALDLIRVARGAREVLAVTARGLQQAIGVSHVWILVADDAGSYVDASSGITPLSAETLLPRILDDAETAVDLAAHEGLRALLAPA